MRRLASLGIVLAVLCVTAIAFASNASASEFIPATNATGAGGTTTLETLAGSKITCTSVVTTLVAANGQEGTAHFMFAGCKDGTLKCQSLGDGPDTEVVLALAQYDIVKLLPTGVAALVTLNPEVHLECMNATLTVNVLLLIKGKVLLQITPVNKKVKTTEKFTVTVTQTKGDPTLKEYDAGSFMSSAVLLVSVEGGPFESAAFESKEDTLTPEKETELKE